MLMGWAGLGWAGLGWAGLGWAGLGWAGETGLHESPSALVTGGGGGGGILHQDWVSHPETRAIQCHALTGSS